MTPQELQLLEIIRELKPFEVVEIHKDKLGRPNFYVVKREQKIEIKPDNKAEINSIVRSMV